LNARVRGIIFAILGLMLIGTGAFAVIQLMGRGSFTGGDQATPTPIVLTDVMMVTHDVYVGQQLQEADVVAVGLPADQVPLAAVLIPEDVIGKFIKVDLVPGEIIWPHNLADPTNVNHDMSFILGDNHVLMAFPATDLISREAVIMRGDIVDILATLPFEEIYRVENNDAEAVDDTETITETTTGLITFDALQRANVTAMVVDIITAEEAQATTEEEGDPSRDEIVIRAYLLALEPQNALMLKHLKDTGAIFDLVMRAPASTTIFELTPVTQEYLTEYYGLDILP
jgi:pilus assembly protein CpaB